MLSKGTIYYLLNTEIYYHSPYLGLNKMEIQLNLCNIFYILIFNKLYSPNLFASRRTLNRVKLGRAITFMKYRASVVSLIFLPKNSIWNKITLPASNSLNELTKSISKKYLPMLQFLSDLSLLNVKISRAYN